MFLKYFLLNGALKIRENSKFCIIFASKSVKYRFSQNKPSGVLEGFLSKKLISLIVRMRTNRGSTVCGLLIYKSGVKIKYLVVYFIFNQTKYF